MTDNPEAQHETQDAQNEERQRRWRLILGAGGDNCLSSADHKMDGVLGQLYGRGRKTKRKQRQSRRGNNSNQANGMHGQQGDKRSGGLEASIPNVSQWLGDIRKYFPDTVVQVMQQDAIEALGLHKMLTEPEILEHIQPDVNLVATLLSLKDAIPDETKHTARILVRKVVEDLMKRLEEPMRQAIRGALNKANRKMNPRHQEIDWHRTIRANLKHYLPDYQTVIPELLIGFQRRKRTHQRHVIICIDQSGSMMTSMVYASIFGAVMASIPALKTHMVVFDTSVVDLTAQLHDPVDLLFGTTLGGGTDINQALGYCQRLIERPDDTTLILISDLYEGGNVEQMLQRVGQIVQSGVQMVALLALSDKGAPSYDKGTASDFVTLGATAFACTPDLFPDLMAATMNRKDLTQWAGQNDIKVARPKT